MSRHILPFFRNKKPARESSSSSDGSGYCGFKVVAPGQGCELDIIAIHGLNGHRERTWTADDEVLWLRDFLPKRFPRARIATYGFEARTHGRSGELSIESLNDHGEKFLSRLFYWREETETSERPIIFLAHSLGGIVLKSALIHAALTSSTHNQEYESVKRSTCGVVFLGTPHQGGNGVSWAKLAVQVISVYAKTSNRLLEHLETQSEFLQDQLRQYKGISSSFQTAFIYEGRETPIPGGGSILVVPKWSACVPGVVNAKEMSLDKNHHTLVKFKSEEDDDYIILSRILLQMFKDGERKVQQDWEQWHQLSSGKSNRGTIHTERDKKGSLFQRFGFDLGVNIPWSQPEVFVGRHDALTRLDQVLSSKSRISVLYGTPGIGKTQTARKYCYDQSSKFSSVFWINASSLELIKASFGKIAETLVQFYANLLPHPPPYARLSEELGLGGLVSERGQIAMDADASDRIVHAVMAWMNLKDNNHWLIVYDSYDDPGSVPIGDYIPSSGRILVTSRIRENARLGQGIELQDLSKDEAVTLLLLSSQKSEVSPAESEAALAIVQRLGRLPLAIDQAGANIFSDSLHLRDYLPLLDENARDILSEEFPSCGSQSQNHAVSSTFETSFIALERSSALSAKALTLCSFFADESLPIDILFGIMSRDKKLMRKLYSFSLIKKTGYRDITIHPLVRICARERLSLDEKEKFSLEAFDALGRELYVKNEHDLSSEELCIGRNAIPHLRQSIAWLHRLNPTRSQSKSHASALRNSALVFQNHGLYEEASLCYNRAIEIQRAELGSESLEVATTKLGLAKLYRLLYRNEQASQMYEESLRVFKRDLGSDSLRTIRAVAGLGAAKWKQSRLTDAQALLETAISIYRTQLPQNDPEILVATETLGLVFMALANYDEAKRRIEEARQINTERFGIAHPTTLRNMANLSICLQHQSQLQEAEEMHRQVLEIGIPQMGLPHPFILRAFHNTAFICYKQSKYSHAISLCETAVAGCEKTLGKESLETLGSIELLGVILHAKGAHEDAAEHLKKALNGFKSHAGGTGSLDAARALKYLGEVYVAQGSLDKAKQCFEESLQGYQKFLTSEHPQTKDVEENLLRLSKVEKSESGIPNEVDP